MSTPQRLPVAVLGAGSWGTALAVLLARQGRPTLLWGNDPAQMAQLARERCNPRYLPGVELPPALGIESDLTTTLANARDILVVVPSVAFGSVLEQLAPLRRPDSRVAWGTKGIDPSGRLLHEVAGEVLGTDCPTAVISGPSFAREVAAGLPTAVTVASAWPAFAAELAELLHDQAFRAYTSTDVIGVQLGGSVKNVLAVAAGIADGLGFGANARAALITRGLAEMVRLGSAMGGRRETFMGLAGLGDLVLTCTDDQSRNRRFGLALGRGESAEAAIEAIGQVVEGMRTSAEVHRLAQRQQVEMPIAEQVHAVLYRGHTPHEAVTALLARELKPETW